MTSGGPGSAAGIQFRSFRLESYLYGPHGTEEMTDDRVCGHFDCHVGGDGCMIVDRGCTDSHTV